MAEKTFKLKTDAKEYDGKRFGERQVKYWIPDEDGDVLAQVRERVAPGNSADKVIAGFITGQGIALTIQKEIKEYLASDAATKNDDTDAVLAEAQKRALDPKFTEPNRRTGGGGKKGKVAQAEAKAEEARKQADGAKDMARQMYLDQSAAKRKQYRPLLISQGTFTEAELDELDAQK